ncbi:MAG TPA: hypothetical protein PK752_20860, partial [Accumulibacter sp.]|uniref:hypothetical protein n=1 Tax=Accumulibacter sp. TaxID=2053492 RepID=UPI002BE02D1A
QMTAAQGIGQSALVNDAAMRSVDQDGLRLHSGDGFSPEKTAAGGGQRQVQGNDVGRSQQVIEAHRFDIQLSPQQGTRCVRRIAGNDPAADGAGEPGGQLTDSAKADEPQCLASRLAAAGVIRAWPSARGEICRTVIVVAQGDQHHRQNVFCNRAGIGPGGGVHGNAARAACYEVDVVQPDTQATDHFQPRRPAEQLPIDPGPVADDQGADAGQQAVELCRMVELRGRNGPGIVPASSLRPQPP